MSKYDEEIENILNGNTSYLDSTFPYINDVDFLKELEKTYANLEHYEVASIINDRVRIITAKDQLNKELDSLNNKITLLKSMEQKNE
jgi:hypothetical protein